MGFRLVTIGKFSGNRELPTPAQVAPNLGDPHAKFLVRQVNELAGDVPVLWKEVHTTFLRDYHPVWHRIDEQDILVGWAAAGLALNMAKRDLARIDYMSPNLTSRQRATRDARLADIRFWGRLLPEAVYPSGQWLTSREFGVGMTHKSWSQNGH